MQLLTVVAWCCLQLVPGVMQQGLRPALPACMPDDLAALLEACWQHDPSQRPSFQHILLELLHLRSAWGVSGWTVQQCSSV